MHHLPTFNHHVPATKNNFECNGDETSPTSARTVTALLLLNNCSRCLIDMSASNALWLVFGLLLLQAGAAAAAGPGESSLRRLLLLLGQSPVPSWPSACAHWGCIAATGLATLLSNNTC